MKAVHDILLQSLLDVTKWDDKTACGSEELKSVDCMEKCDNRASSSLKHRHNRSQHFIGELRLVSFVEASVVSHYSEVQYSKPLSWSPDEFPMSKVSHYPPRIAASTWILIEISKDVPSRL